MAAPRKARTAKAKPRQAPARRKRGRPEFVPTDEERNTVEVMAAIGTPQAEICKVIRRPSGRERLLKAIDEKTLAKHFRDELALGAVKANAKVGKSIYDRAIDPKNPAGMTAAIWWSKNRMGWTDKGVIEHTGKGGGPIEQHIVLTPEALAGATDEELEALERVLRRTVANAA